MTMNEQKDRSLSENLFFTIQSLDSLIKSRDPGLDFMSTHSLLHYFREISLIIYHSSLESEEDKQYHLMKSSDDREFAGKRFTALDSLQLLISIGSHLDFFEKDDENPNCSKSPISI